MELSIGVWVTYFLDFLNMGGTFRKGSFLEWRWRAHQRGFVGRQHHASRLVYGRGLSTGPSASTNRDPGRETKSHGQKHDVAILGDRRN